MKYILQAALIAMAAALPFAQASAQTPASPPTPQAPPQVEATVEEAQPQPEVYRQVYHYTCTEYDKVKIFVLATPRDKEEVEKAINKWRKDSKETYVIAPNPDVVPFGSSVMIMFHYGDRNK